MDIHTLRAELNSYIPKAAALGFRLTYQLSTQFIFQVQEEVFTGFYLKDYVVYRVWDTNIKRRVLIVVPNDITANELDHLIDQSAKYEFEIEDTTALESVRFEDFNGMNKRERLILTTGVDSIPVDHNPITVLIKEPKNPVVKVYRH